ncbi:Pro-Pol polyprotein [Frankliniella fusca]|uniref:Pro-Pol polyprotein n=1 Tax=Frankliniella fusca TaxID=407009 RepID=A0AAE1LVS7_9NEOP|nr:Pro-Pol polyprotein [Frankliniella fusca]
MTDNVPFKSKECLEYYKKKDITFITSTPHYHQSNGQAEKSVGIVKKMIKKCRENNEDWIEAVMEYNNTPILSLNASPSQILNSRIMRGRNPVMSSVTEPVIQEDIYEKLLDNKEKMCKQYDKTARKIPDEYKKDDKVVVRTEESKKWEKATVITRDKADRSYIVQMDKNDSIVRRNTFQMRPSNTKEDKQKESNFYPDLDQEICGRIAGRRREDQEHHEQDNDRQNFVPDRENTVINNANENNQNVLRTHSRYGRAYKPNKKYL